MPAAPSRNSGIGPHTGIHISSDVVHDQDVQAVVQRTALDRRVHERGMWTTITAALKSTPATTGGVNHRTALYSRPFADQRPQQPGGVASSANGGRK